MDNSESRSQLLESLEERFRKNMHRHKNLDWEKVKQSLELHSTKLDAILQMEQSGGEPDVVSLPSAPGKMIFCDCAKESPAGRRSLCYDREALDARKEHKPKNSAMDLAGQMGIELLTEDQYKELQELEPFDLKTSSWLKTPADVRSRGGAIFGDCRYGRVFIYHNGAESYYAARGFRGLLVIQ